MAEVRGSFDAYGTSLNTETIAYLKLAVHLAEKMCESIFVCLSARDTRFRSVDHPSTSVSFTAPTLTQVTQKRGYNMATKKPNILILWATTSVSGTSATSAAA